MPREPPVTSATLPDSEKSVVASMLVIFERHHCRPGVSQLYRLSMFNNSVGVELVLSKMGYDFLRDGILGCFAHRRGDPIRPASHGQSSRCVNDTEIVSSFNS